MPLVSVNVFLPPYSGLILTENPTGYWKMDETTGTTMIDSSGNGHDGTYIGSGDLTISGGIPVGNGTKFENTLTAEVPHDNALNAAGEFCIEMFARFTGAIKGMAFGKFALVGTFDGPTVFFNSGISVSNSPGQILFRERDNPSNQLLSTATNLNDNVWRHYVFQRRLVSTGPDVWKLEIFINGVLDNDFTLSGPLSFIDTETLYIGSRTGVQKVNGGFDEVVFYADKALLPSTIAAHAAYLNPPTVPTLDTYFEAIMASRPASYWRFDETSGTVIEDSAGRQNGTLINSPTLGEPPGISVGTSIAFDGSTQSSEVPDLFIDELNPRTNEWAVEFVAKYTSATLGMAFGKFSNSNPFPGVTIFFNYTDTGVVTPGVVMCRNSGLLAESVHSVTGALNDGVFRHYVFQRRNDAGTLKLEIYIDGVLDNFKVLGSFIDLNTQNPLYLASRTGTQYIDGTFDEMVYYQNKALTPTEVATHFAAV